MKLISWNVNGIRAVYKKNLSQFIQKEQPDIFCVQETKAHPEQVEPDILNLKIYDSQWSSAVRKGYSGVATYWNQQNTPNKISKGIGFEKYDSEGRFVITEHEHFKLYNIYFPNGGSGEERHDFKQKFLKDLYDHLKPQVEAGEKIIVTGDYNIAHTEIDVHDPVRLSKESGFLPEERAWLTEFFNLGFIDTFRYFHKDEKERYSWWSYREMARVRNKGWRIDYFSITPNLKQHLVRADILDTEEGSDHCPLLLELNF